MPERTPDEWLVEQGFYGAEAAAAAPPREEGPTRSRMDWSGWDAWRRATGDVNWGLTGCGRPSCEEEAAVFVEDFGVLCLGCADELVQRTVALELAREAGVDLPLPDWDDHVADLEVLPLLELLPRGEWDAPTRALPELSRP